jgi:hypothetical protein
LLRGHSSTSTSRRTLTGTFRRTSLSRTMLRVAHV